MFVVLHSFYFIFLKTKGRYLASNSMIRKRNVALSQHTSSQKNMILSTPRSKYWCYNQTVAESQGCDNIINPKSMVHIVSHPNFQNEYFHNNYEIELYLKCHDFLLFFFRY